MNEKGKDAAEKRAKELESMKEKLTKEDKKDLVLKVFEMGMKQNDELLKKVAKE